MIKPPPLTAQEEAAHALRTWILGGRYTAGSRLPAERKLSEDLGISRLTLRGALTTLASEGLVRSHPGSGVEVLDWRERGAPDLFHWLLARAESEQSPEVVADLFEQVVHMRRLVALDVLVRAAEQVCDEDVRLLEEMASAQSGRVDDPEAYLEGDEAYQRKLLRIANAPLVELLFNSLRRAVWRRTDLVLAFMGPLREHLVTYDLVHELLRSGDARTFRPLAERALGFIEAKGLRRVRQVLQDERKPEPEPEPVSVSPFAREPVAIR